MKAITLHPLWAWLIIHGPKRVENRSWPILHRGPLAIHAGKNRSLEAEDLAWLDAQGIRVEPPDPMPTQQVLGIVEVVDCRPMGPDLRGDPFASGPWCWILAHPRPLAEPIACRGRQGLWNIDLPADCLTRPTRPARPAARRLF